MSPYNLFIEDDQKNPVTTAREVGKTLGQFLSLVILFVGYEVAFSSFVETNSYTWLMFVGMVLLSMGLFVLAGRLNFIVHLIFAAISLIAMYFMNANTHADGKISSWLMIFVSVLSLVLFVYALWIGMKSMSGLQNLVTTGGALGSIFVLFTSFYGATA